MAKLAFIPAAIVAVLALAVVTSAQQQQQQQQTAPRAEGAEVEKSIAVLTSATSGEREKAVACQRLGMIADAKAVPALAALLGDEKLGHAARMALEVIPDPAVDAALRNALTTVKSRALAGVINSIGNRRDSQAVGALAKHLRGEDAEVRRAAALALGRIANEQAIEAMEGAIASSPEGLKPAAFDAYLAAADTVCAGGRCEQAARMFERLSGEDAPRPVRSAAVRGLIVARGHPDGTTLAVKHLRSDDEALFAAALGVVQEVKGPELTAAYANELATLPVERRVRLIDALAGRGGAESLAAIRKAAGSSESPVRVAALRALAQVGDAEGVTELVSAATGEDAEAARAAQQGLVMFPGSTADEAVLGLMGSDKAAVRRLGIDLAAKRQVAGASAALANATRDKDEQTRVAAIRALGEVAPADEIGSVIAVLVNAKAGAEVEAAERAVAAVIARAEPREATVEPLLSGMKDAGAAGRCALLRLLATAGGPKALEAVRGATKAFDKQVQDAAIRALCSWSGAEPAADVLAIAKESENPVHKRLALRGYVRMIGDRQLTPERRDAMCREAAALAQSADDRKLVLGVLGMVPTGEALGVVVAWMDDAAVSEEAVAAALAIAEKLGPSEPDAVKAALAKAAQTTKSEDLLRRVTALLGQAGGNEP